ncbi:hypothetical protein Ciccas_011267 [Cichlidogyrus casuarinus]|uniref:Uncharacterized protein n=1 Tax=Cichlidogyrus casuarinus TaxID=1844966 RepID=A0ABD2PRR8_9PLAT
MPIPVRRETKNLLFMYRAKSNYTIIWRRYNGNCFYREEMFIFESYARVQLEHFALESSIQVPRRTGCIPSPLSQGDWGFLHWLVRLGLVCARLGLLCDRQGPL